MSSRSRTSNVRKIATAALVAAALGGCSDIYYDRRDTIALGADDAVASNRVTHMVDPWPRHAGNRNLAFNGERMQTAVERYRHNKVIEPVNVTTSSAALYAQQAAQAAAASPTAVPSAAPVK
jgi:hypothetical protein